MIKVVFEIALGNRLGMEIAPPKQRRSHQQRLDDAQQKADRAAKRLVRNLRQVEKYEVAGRLVSRKRDTRRKIIAGALALEEKDRVFRGKLLALIDEYVTADRDRELFGLAPLPEPADNAAAAQQAA